MQQFRDKPKRQKPADREALLISFSVFEEEDEVNAARTTGTGCIKKEGRKGAGPLGMQKIIGNNTKVMDGP